MKKILSKLLLLGTIIGGLIGNKIINVYANELDENLFSSVDNFELILNENEFEIIVDYDDEEYSINLDYNYYENNNGVYNYYIADCLINSRQNNCMDIVQVAISDFEFHALNNDYRISLYFHIDDVNKLFLVEEEFSSSQFTYVNVQTNQDDEIKERLDQSFMIPYLYDDYGDSNDDLIIVPNPGGMIGNNPILGPLSSDINLPDTGENGNIESISELYTSTDEYLDKYSFKGASSVSWDSKFKVDDIIYIIPKYYFCNEGKHTYIGKEYGFYIETDKKLGGAYNSQVFVFDIELVLPGFKDSQSKAYITIIPKIQGVYEYYDYSYSSALFIDFIEEGYTCALFPYEETFNLFLSEVSFRFTTENKNSLNLGDENYDPLLDDGDFVWQTDYSFEGVEGKTFEKNFVLDLVEFTLGAIPVIGEIIDAANYYKMLNDYIIGKYDPQYISVSSNNRATCETYPSYIEDQLEEFGKILKTVSIKPVNQDIDGENVNPLLIGNGDEEHFVSANVLYNAEGTLSTCQESNLYVGIDFDIVQDNRWLLSFDWLQFGNVDKLVECETVLINSYKRGQDYISLFSTHNESSIAGEYEYNKFIPDESGLYRIGTTGNKGTFVEIYDGSGKSLSSSSNSESSTSVCVELRQGNTYHIKTGFYNEEDEGSYGIYVSQEPIGNIILNNPIYINFNDDYKIYSFSPTITKNYVIQTVGNTDTKIDLMYLDGTIIASNDNYINQNARININLRAGYTYYIKVYISGFTNDGFSYGVTNLIVSPAS